MARVVIRPRARDDLIEIWLWIAREGGQRTADRILERIERRIAALGEHPEMAPIRPDIASDARALVVERWLVLYRIENAVVDIVRVVDGARDLRRVGRD